MKVLFILGHYLPEKNAGMENYTHWIAGLLQNKGWEVSVAVTRYSKQEDVFDAVKIYKTPDLNSFENILNLNFDVCHFMEFSGNEGINLNWFEMARKKSQKIFFTFHLPYFTCYKSDFRFMNKSDCEVFNDAKRCAECVIQHKLENKLSNAQINILGKIILKTPFIGSTVLNKMDSFHYPLKHLDQICDAVFVYPNWFKNILKENGFWGNNFKQIPYKNRPDIEHEFQARIESDKFRLIFVGRIQYQKGLHLLTKALNSLNDSDIELTVYGNIIDQEYFDKCKNDFSFDFRGTTTRIELSRQFQHFDFLVLPSVFPEMSSMVLKDAFNQHLPVIASASKGNKDAIENGVNGFLFDYDNSISLATVLKQSKELISDGWKRKFQINTDFEKEEELIISYYL